MRRGTLIALAILLAVALGVGAVWLHSPEKPAETRETDLAALLGGEDVKGFARADRPRRFEFPADHGPHPDFRSEWWYFTGNLRTGTGRRFGYELALFRFALAPEAPGLRSAWATNQVYMGHFALTDVRGQRFFFFDRFARGAAGLAGAEAEPFRVWVEDWRVEGDPGFPWHLRAAAPEAPSDIALALSLAPAKPIVLQGDRGLSRKSAEGHASYYYSIPRLDTHGTLRLGGESFTLSGLSWLDREWSTQALAPGQAGWDWFALQLSDGSDLMFYQLRRRDGSVDRFSGGVLIGPQGETRRLGPGDVELAVLDTWQSPHGGNYPARWRMTIEPLDLRLDITPVLADQELALTPRYWEGAVDVTGARGRTPISGQGYVELTGYGDTTALAR